MSSCCHLCCLVVQCKTWKQPEQEGLVAGKSECSRCHSAQGRFCRACLLVRYGLKLEDVLAAADTWLCPHCYEEDHPDEVPFPFNPLSSEQMMSSLAQHALKPLEMCSIAHLPMF